MPLDPAAVPLAGAEALAGRPVLIPPGNLGAWDAEGGWDVYAVAGDGDSERGVPGLPGPLLYVLRVEEVSGPE